MLYADPPVDAPALDRLLDLLRGRRLVVLAGAGISTESGIPDYRGPEGSLRSRKPMQYGEFVRSEEARRRYWARSAVGWSRVHRAAPNEGHRALARLESGGAVRGVITQNVDGLHRAAGSERVVELHGALDRVCCLQCRGRTPRSEMQRRLEEANPGWLERVARGDVDPGRSSAKPAPEPAPDGDAELAPRAVDGFRVPACDCGGILKPDVVFFGENVPAEVVEAAWALFDDADALLVVGSSLQVFSGRRFVYRAGKEGRPIGIVTLGPTRADELAHAKVEGRLGAVLPVIADELLEGR